MSRKRFVPDAWLGLLDLVFLLCMLFFLTTVISVRQVALAEDVADDEARGEQVPVVVRLERTPTSAGAVPQVTLTSAGPHEAPQVGVSVLRWLEATCRAQPTRVEVACPEDATHLACKRGVLGIRRAARACQFRY